MIPLSYAVEGANKTKDTEALSLDTLNTCVYTVKSHTKIVGRLEGAYYWVLTFAQVC